MRQYTVILNFREGIYVSQHMAEHISAALLKWAEGLNAVKYIGQHGKAELIELMREENPILLKGMTNVWCISGILKTGFFIANIVESQ